jgi:hypothetical protein
MIPSKTGEWLGSVVKGSFHYHAGPQTSISSRCSKKSRPVLRPASVNGQVEDPNFGRIVSAASARLVQLVAEFHF